MAVDKPFRPSEVFSVEDGTDQNVPRVFISPARYIQGPDVLKHIGRYLKILPSSEPLILISSSGENRFGSFIRDSLRKNGLNGLFLNFNGECSMDEIERILSMAKQNDSYNLDCVVAVGGGKCVDTGKSVAYRMGLPSVIIPSLASNDAPCSALSVIYSSEGVSQGAEYFPDSPAIVVVDSKIVAEAPVRYLVSGMGDAMATWYEAKTCFNNLKGRTTVGARPTLAAGAIGELCAATLYEYGMAGVSAVEQGIVDDALERIVESNTLLSGLGFESGGLAGAHSVAQAFTVIPKVQETYLHGEMVAFGLLTQLVFEDDGDEAEKAAEFFAKVGLPVNLKQLSVERSDKNSLERIMTAALNASTMRNEPMELKRSDLIDAALVVDKIGTQILDNYSDMGYSKLH